MSTRLPNDYRELDNVFVRARPLIQSALVGQYGLSREEAADVERNLREWFVRFSKRSGSTQAEHFLEQELLLMACRAGHVYSLSQQEGSSEERRRSLVLGPEVIAIEITRRSRESEDAP
jgi:hypothetical protein